MPPEPQAEIAFGRENSEVPADDLVALAQSALDRDHIWQEDAEPYITELRNEATQELPPYAGKLAVSVRREIAAWQAAWQQDFDRAFREAVEVLNQLTGQELRPTKPCGPTLAAPGPPSPSTRQPPPNAPNS